MKGKIGVFIIGVLVGAIITSAGFLIYNKVNGKNKMRPNGERPNIEQRNRGNTTGEDGEMPEPPEGMDGEMPEPPDGERPDNKKTNSENTNTTNTTTQESVS